MTEFTASKEKVTFELLLLVKDSWLKLLALSYHHDYADN